MEARELRIGNLFYGCDNAVTSVKLIESNSINMMRDFSEMSYTLNSGDPLMDARPIHLTKEWLVRLGFEIERNRYRLGDILIYETSTDLFSFNLRNSEKKIEYVHQLQNLYFALTGEELTLNKSLKITYEEYGKEGSKVTLTKH